MNLRTVALALGVAIALAAPTLAQDKMGKMGKMHKMDGGKPKMAGKMACAGCAKATKANHGKATMCAGCKKKMAAGKMHGKM